MKKTVKALTPMQKAYRYMYRVQNIDNLISRKQEQVNNLRSLATSTQRNDDTERVQSSGSEDKVGKYCAKIVDLCAEINCDIDKLVDTKRQVIKTIDSLENNYQREVLYYRYLENLDFKTISIEMEISEIKVYRLHKAGMLEISKMFIKN